MSLIQLSFHKTSLEHFLDKGLTGPDLGCLWGARRDTEPVVGFESIVHFAEAIPQLVVARAALGCEAYARALRHHESHVRGLLEQVTPGGDGTAHVLSECAPLLQRIYAGLDEPDGLKGVAHLRSQPSLEDRILDLENAGKWRDAFMCYDQAIPAPTLPGMDTSTQSHSHKTRRLRCLLQLGQLETILHLTLPCLNNHLTSIPEPALFSYAVQAAWRLAQWDTLQALLPRPFFIAINDERATTRNTTDPIREEGREGEETFEVGLGALLLAVRAGDSGAVANGLEAVRDRVMSAVGTASMESYTRAYPAVAQLHALHDLEYAFALMQKQPLPGLDSPALASLLHIWDLRFKTTQASLKAREPILHLHRYSCLLHPNLKKQFS